MKARARKQQPTLPNTPRPLAIVVAIVLEIGDLVGRERSVLVGWLVGRRPLFGRIDHGFVRHG